MQCNFLSLLIEKLSIVPGFFNGILSDSKTTVNGFFNANYERKKTGGNLHKLSFLN
jgi:hypothetical protein